MRAAQYLVATVLLLLVAGPTGRAHRPIASKYTYTADVLPIFRAHCGGCHRPGGVGPMSLVSYDEARPWAQSIKEEVVSLRMPPRYAEPGFGPIRNGHTLSARELDTIVDWATGGTPEGPRAQAPSTKTAPAADEGWRLGPPDLELSLEEPFTLTADRMAATRTFVLPTGLKTPQWVRAMDIQPGTPSIVRSAVAWVDTSGEARKRDAADPGPGFADAGSWPEKDVLLVWTPGDDPLSLDETMGIRLPAGADVVLRLSYKKTWRQEGEVVSDRTRLGLYFRRGGSARPIRTLRVLAGAAPARADGAASDGAPSGLAPEVAAVVPQDVELRALVPGLAAPLESLRVEVVRPDGTRAPLLRLTRPRPEWPARYWLDSPLRLARGSRIAATADGTGPVVLQVEYTLPAGRPGSR